MEMCASAEETAIAAAGNVLDNWEHVKLDATSNRIDLDAGKIKTVLSTALSNATLGKVGEKAYLPPDAGERCRDFLGTRPVPLSKRRDARQSFASHRVTAV